MTNGDSRNIYFQRVFGWQPPDPTSTNPEIIRQREIVAAALNTAEEVRRFEIGLYWRRALYFWGFNVAIFTGVGVFLAGSDASLLQEVISLLLAMLGLFVTIAWWFMSEGAKAWQENWEHHVYMLEDTVTGRLMKTQFVGKSCFFSVSRINKSVIIAISLFWGAVASLLGARLIIRIEIVIEALQAYSVALVVAAGGVFLFCLAVLMLSCLGWRSTLHGDRSCCKPCTCKNDDKDCKLMLHQRQPPHITCCGSKSQPDCTKLKQDICRR